MTPGATSGTTHAGAVRAPRLPDEASQVIQRCTAQSGISKSNQHRLPFVGAEFQVKPAAVTEGMHSDLELKRLGVPAVPAVHRHPGMPYVPIDAPGTPAEDLPALFVPPPRANGVF